MTFFRPDWLKRYFIYFHYLLLLPLLITLCTLLIMLTWHVPPIGYLLIISMLLIGNVLLLYIIHRLRNTIHKITAAIPNIDYQEAALHPITHHDPLTHFPNRTLFTKQLEQLLQSSHNPQQLVAFFSIHILQYSELRQELLLPQQELLIKMVADNLRTIAPKQAVIGRIAESEFAMAISELTNTIQIYMLSQHLFQTLNSAYNLNGHEIHLTFNMGIAIYPLDTTNMLKLMHNASLAAHYANISSQDNYLFYTEAMHDEMAMRRKRLAELHRAIDRNQLCLYFQAQMNIQQKTLCGFEALLRWQHPEYGAIPPAQFIPLAEENDLINKIGDWVINKVLQQSALWEQEYQLQLHASLNISSRQLLEKNFLHKVASQLKATHCHAQFIAFELTESIMLHDKDVVLNRLHQLNAMGLKLVIDDFGTGYSSMSYLKQLPVHSLKIDKSFIDEITTNTNNQAIVKAIIQLGQSLGLKIVAEGVETADQLTLLQTYGCDIAQGYLIGHPLPAAAFSQLLAQSVINR